MREINKSVWCDNSIAIGPAQEIVSVVPDSLSGCVTAASFGPITSPQSDISNAPAGDFFLNAGRVILGTIAPSATVA